MATRDKPEKFKGPGRFRQALAFGSGWSIMGVVLTPIAFVAAGANWVRNWLKDPETKPLLDKLMEAQELEVKLRMPTPPAPVAGLPAIQVTVTQAADNVAEAAGPMKQFAETHGKDLLRTVQNAKGAKLMLASLFIVPAALGIGLVRGWMQAGRSRKQFERVRNERDLANARLEGVERVLGASDNTLDSDTPSRFTNRLSPRAAGFAASRLAEKESLANAEQTRS